MSESIKNVEYYENVRDLYAEEVSKNPNAVRLYSKKFEADLRKHRITVLDPKEVCRIGLYLEDVIDRQELAPDFNIGTWLLEQMRRNPVIYNKYFRHSNPVSLPKNEIEEKPEAKPPQILPDLSHAQTPQEIKAEEAVTKKLWEEPKNMVELEETPSLVNELIPVYVEPHPDDNKVDDSKNENEDIKVSEDDFNKKYLAEHNELDIVAFVQKQKRDEMMLQLQRVVEAAMGVNYYDRESLLAQLAEAVIYKKAMAGLFSELGVESSFTSFDAGITERRIAFNPDRNYTIEEIKRGLAHAQIRIGELTKLEAANKDLATRIRNQENVISRLGQESKQFQQRLDDQQKLVKVEPPKTAPVNMQILYVCISWNEKDESGKIATNYLTTTNKEVNDDGFYLTKCMVKTTKRVEAIRFPSRERAKAQLSRIIKNYKKHINRKCGISLEEHLKKAELVVINVLHESKAYEPPVKQQS